MKQILLFFFAFTILFANGQGKVEFLITGKLINANGKQLYLTQRGAGITPESKVVMLDSCIVNNGRFIFKGRLDEPNYYAILVAKGKGWKYFILDNSSKLAFSGNADSIWRAEVTGSADNRLLDSIKHILSPMIRKSNKIGDSISTANQQGDSIEALSLRNKLKILKKEQDAVRVDFIQKNPNCFESLSLLSRVYHGMNNDLQKRLYNGLSNRLKYHSIGQEIRYQIFELAKTLTEPLSFSQADTTGRMISIDRYRGSYLLVDFWASWCGPCRAENPNLKKAYNKYKSKGFEVVAVSLDSKKTNWVNAIKKDSLDWVHVSDLKGGQNEVAIKYRITSIPFNYLLNKQGKVIDKNLRGNELMKKLSEIFDE